MLEYLDMKLLLNAIIPTAKAQSIITDGIAGCDFVTGQISAGCVPAFIAHVIGWIAGFLGAGFLIVIIWAGYEFALGDITGNIDAGKQRLQFGITGFIVSILAFAIIQFVIATLTP